MQHDDKSPINRIYDALLEKLHPDTVKKENDAKMERLKELDANSDATKSIDDIRRRLRRNK